MAERTEPIRQDIEATRASMTETLEQIEGQVREKVDTTVAQAREALDLRQHIEKRPWLAIGAASLLGYLVGTMGGDDDMPPPRPATPGQPMRYYTPPANTSQPSHTSSEERHAQNGNGNSYAYGGQPSSANRPSQFAGVMAQVADPIREELSVMAMAAVRSAMRVLRETLQDSIPQFGSEYESVQRERGEGDEPATPTNAAAYVARPGAQSESGTYGARPGASPSL